MELWKEFSDEEQLSTNALFFPNVPAGNERWKRGKACRLRLQQVYLGTEATARHTAGPVLSQSPEMHVVQRVKKMDVVQAALSSTLSFSSVTSVQEKCIARPSGDARRLDMLIEREKPAPGAQGRGRENSSPGLDDGLRRGRGRGRGHSQHMQT